MRITFERGFSAPGVSVLLREQYGGRGPVAFGYDVDASVVRLVHAEEVLAGVSLLPLLIQRIPVELLVVIAHVSPVSGAVPLQALLYGICGLSARGHDPHDPRSGHHQSRSEEVHAITSFEESSAIVLSESSSMIVDSEPSFQRNFGHLRSSASGCPRNPLSVPHPTQKMVGGQ